MNMMAASNNFLDEKISVINSVIGNTPLDLAEAYDYPDIWITIAAVASQM